MVDFQESYMKRCIQLALSGQGSVAPNPMVGCVIVYNDKIIGEGFHRVFGGHHAEVEAINNVTDKSLLPHSTLYVNLEPCAHFGKTPPCSDLIISYKIPKVVIGCTDPFIEVKGKGIEKLKLAGVEVVTDVLKDEAMELNKRFFIFHQFKRPYIILKWAQSSDGFLAGASSQTKWISNKWSRTLVHKWRSEEQAIMVGTNTAMKDNPQLDVRQWIGKNPKRIVIDRQLKLPNHLYLFDQKIETLVFTEIKKDSQPNIEYITIDFEQLHQEINDELFARQVQSLIVEGGAQLLNSYISNNVWDEARVFTAPHFLTNGIEAPKISGVIDKQIYIDNDRLTILKNR